MEEEILFDRPWFEWEKPFISSFHYFRNFSLAYIMLRYVMGH